MRVRDCTILLAVLIAASCEPTERAAGRERWARFYSAGSARGDDTPVSTMTPAEQVAIYEPLLPGPTFWVADSAGHPIDDRAILDARYLSGGARKERMPDALRAALLATERFAASCDHDIMHSCAEVTGRTLIAFSPIYGIAPGVVRVSVLWSSDRSGEEVMFRLEQRDGKWIVTDRMTTMIT